MHDDEGEYYVMHDVDSKNVSDLTRREELTFRHLRLLILRHRYLTMASWSQSNARSSKVWKSEIVFRSDMSWAVTRTTSPLHGLLRPYAYAWTAAIIKHIKHQGSVILLSRYTLGGPLMLC